MRMRMSGDQPVRVDQASAGRSEGREEVVVVRRSERGNENKISSVCANRPN